MADVTPAEARALALVRDGRVLQSVGPGVEGERFFGSGARTPRRDVLRRLEERGLIDVDTARNSGIEMEPVLLTDAGRAALGE